MPCEFCRNDLSKCIMYWIAVVSLVTAAPHLLISRQNIFRFLKDAFLKEARTLEHYQTKSVAPAK